MKNILTKKAMTLFELLAVIVILGIILAIGFPTATRLINNSRKDSFVANVNSYVAAAKADALSEWAAKGESVTVKYTVKKEGSTSENVVVETFGLVDEDYFTAGTIEIVVDEDGTIKSIKLVEDFVGKGFRTNLVESSEGTVLTKPITRDDIIRANDSEEGEKE